jgi:hypothetical protein
LYSFSAGLNCPANPRKQKKADAPEHQRCSIASAYSLTGLPAIEPGYPSFSHPKTFDILPGEPIYSSADMVTIVLLTSEGEKIAGILYMQAISMKDPGRNQKCHFGGNEPFRTGGYPKGVAKMIMKQLRAGNPKGGNPPGSSKV